MKNEITSQIAEELAQKLNTEEGLVGNKGIFTTLLQKMIQTALDAELTHHLGYVKHAKEIKQNSRNGYSMKTLKSPHGSFTIKTPRDRASTFKPKIVKKNKVHFKGLISKQMYTLYAKGLSSTQIQDQLQSIYGGNYSSSLLSTVTNAILKEVKIWQDRPIDPLYPIVYLDCTYVKVREKKQIIAQPVYWALGINKESQKELLGMWIGKKESEKFGFSILTDLKNRGLKDIFMICINNLKGFKEAIQAVYPESQYSYLLST